MKPLSDIKPSAPPRNVDEHDVIFARMKLKPGTPDWDEYYSTHPEQANSDAKARALPGLLSEQGTNFHRLNFPAADANFDLIEYLQKALNHPVSEKKSDLTAETLTKYIKGWTRYLGTHSTGITELQDYHLYTLRGRGVDKGKPVIKRHKYAIAFTVEMDYDNVQAAPGSAAIFESSQQYLRSANIALQLTALIKKLGYDSRAHIDGDYEVICPLVARDAGLGEIGRMGLLMTPRLGPRVRIAVVTTNAPLVPDKYRPEPNMIEFCRVCKKCADCCPGNSIPNDDIKEIDGVMRWKIDADTCYRYWCTSGTDCGRCMAVCPFSHRDNAFHNLVRVLIRRSRLFARFAYHADDLFYGRKPKPKPSPEWMKE
ncbi:MAG: reductive dehalogenase domain-containing protein [Bacteroidales bacterium]